MSNPLKHKSLIQPPMSYLSSPEVEDFTRDSQNVVPGPAASPSPGSLLEIKILRPHLRSIESETLIVSMFLKTP